MHYPLAFKVDEAIKKASIALPVRVCIKIHCIEFECDDHGVSYYEVTYANGHVLRIEDVDRFPATEHIARIVLECP